MNFTLCRILTEELESHARIVARSRIYERYKAIFLLEKF